jgi:hypothetical protein
MSDHKRRRAHRPHRSARQAGRTYRADWSRPPGNVSVADQWQIFMTTGVWVPASAHAPIKHRSQRQRRRDRRRGQR